jgi:hypothetical protein
LIEIDSNLAPHYLDTRRPLTEIKVPNAPIAKDLAKPLEF